jgi:hypothetical protein
MVFPCRPRCVRVSPAFSADALRFADLLRGAGDVRASILDWPYFAANSLEYIQNVGTAKRTVAIING